MGAREVKATEFTCDNPRCRKSVTHEDPDDFVGLRGGVSEVTGSGGNFAEWVACSRKCAGPAVAAALDTAWEQ